MSFNKDLARLLVPVIILLFLSQTVAAGFLVFVYSDTISTTESEITSHVLGFFLDGQNPFDGNLRTLLHVLPAILMFLCFKSDENRSPTLIGYAVFLIILFNIILMTFNMFVFDKNNEIYSENFIFGEDGIETIQNFSKESFNFSLTYFLLLLGFTAKVE
jgi:hypothetical protein